MPARDKMTPEEFLGTMTDEQRDYYLKEQKRLIHNAVQDVSKADQSKYILVIDFDGVLNSYISGWHGAAIISDPPVQQAQRFCIEALKEFEVWIVSSRCSHPGGAEAIEEWLIKWGFPSDLKVSRDGKKPAAFITIDDRAITFNGLWPDPRELKKFQPWYRRQINEKDTTQYDIDGTRID